MKKFAFSALFLLCLCCSLDAIAQVDMQKQVDSLANLKVKYLLDSINKANTPPPAKPKPFKWSIAFDGNTSGGNLSRSVIGTLWNASYKTQTSEISAMFKFSYGQQNLKTIEREYFSDLTFKTLLSKRFYAFGLSTFDKSFLRNIDWRWLGGIGLGFNVIKVKNHSLTLTNALIYEETNFGTGTEIKTFRNSTRLKGMHTLLGGKVKANHLTFVQPSLIDGKNLRISSLLSIDCPVTKHFSVRAGMDFTRETVIAAGRKNNDLSFRLGVVVMDK